MEPAMHSIVRRSSSLRASNDLGVDVLDPRGLPVHSPGLADRAAEGIESEELEDSADRLVCGAWGSRAV